MKKYTITADFIRDVQSGKTNYYMATKHNLSVRTIRRMKAQARKEGLLDDGADGSMQDYIDDTAVQQMSPMRLAEPVELHVDEPVATYTWVVTPDYLTLFASYDNGTDRYVTPLTIMADTEQFELARSMIIAGETNFDQFFAVTSIAKLNKVEVGNVVVTEDTVTVNGFEMASSSLVGELCARVVNGDDIKALARFLERLAKNPSASVVNRIYDFIKHNDIEITADGTIIAYKKVRGDYLDIYSGTISNAPGCVVEMPRSMVVEDAHKTCEAGLHACAKSYLNSYGSCNKVHSDDRVVRVEIDPADLVAVPTDYSGAKVRCCRYKVLGDVVNI